MKLTCLLLSLFVNDCLCYDALLVAGGYFHQNGQDRMWSSVELLTGSGNGSSCEVASLPEPRIGLTVSRLRNVIVACGGFYRYISRECFTYRPGAGRWTRGPNLPSQELMYASSAGDGDSLFIAGGRNWNYDLNLWRYSNETWRYDLDGGRWTRLPDLNEPTADGCLVSIAGHLIYIGGSDARYRYADDPSKAWVLLRGSNRWRDDIFAPLLAPRMWHACHVTRVGREVGVLLIGGYYNGKAGMFLPLNSDFDRRRHRRPIRWRWFAQLPAERKWGAALGTINGQLAIAGGRNYGDNTVDVFDENYGRWIRSSKMFLRGKREFASHATVPTQWFPHCQ